jgi:hypothetical protein
VTSVLPPADAPASPAGEAAAAVITTVGCVLLGAPVGLLWAAVTPRAEVRAAGQGVSLADPTATAFIAADGYFFALVLLAGALSGVLAVRLGRRNGLGCVLGLTLGGLLAAEVARRTGSLVGLADARAFLEAGQDGTFTLSARLRSTSALVGWPLAGLVVLMFSAAAAAAEPAPRPARRPPAPG